MELSNSEQSRLKRFLAETFDSGDLVKLKDGCQDGGKRARGMIQGETYEVDLSKDGHISLKGYPNLSTTSLHIRHLTDEEHANRK